MSLFKAIVFSDIMQIITTDHDGSLHFHFLDDSSENSATDRHISGEWAFLVDVGAFNSLRKQFNQ